jgi:hypothetical protein
MIRLASQWCALGAIYRAARDLVGDQEKATRIGNEVAKSAYQPDRLFRSLACINDARGHAAVLAVFDEALKAA